MTPEDLAALRAATPQCPEWDAEPYSSHITVWPKADHARVFRVLAYHNGLSYSEMFRRLVEWELVRMAKAGELDRATFPPRVSKKVTARARVGADVVPDDLADGVRKYLIFEHSQPEGEAESETILTDEQAAMFRWAVGSEPLDDE